MSEISDKPIKPFQWVLALYVVSALLWGLFILTVNNKTDWDLWGVMSFGALLDANGWQFPYHDPFSYTAPGAPWIYHEWGSGTVFYGVFKTFGSTGLYALKLLLFALIVLIPTDFAWRYGLGNERRNSPLWAAAYGLLLLLATYLIIPIAAITIRCQLFTFVLFGVFLRILEGYRTSHNPKRLWVLPLLMVVWANLHGGYIVGGVLIGCYLLGFAALKQWHTVKQVLLVGIACALATLVNPYGWALNAHLVYAWSLPRVEIIEWLDVWHMHTPLFGPLYCLLVLLSLGALAMSARQKKSELWPGFTVGHGLVLLAFAYEGYAHSKLSPLFLVTLLMLLPVFLSELRFNFPETTFKRFLSGALGWALPVGVLLLGLCSTFLFFEKTPSPWVVKVQGEDTYNPMQPMTRFFYPIGAVRYLRQNHVTGNLWAPFVWGEFLYWSLYPELKVSIDGRYETLYPARVFEDTYQFYQPPYPVENAEKYDTDYILVSTTNRGLVKKMHAQNNWQIVYQDPAAVLYGRKIPEIKGSTQTFSNHSAPLDAFQLDLDRFKFQEKR